MPLTKTGSSKSSTWTQEGKATTGEAAKSLGWDCSCSVGIYQMWEPKKALVLPAQFWQAETFTMSTKDSASCPSGSREGSLKLFWGYFHCRLSARPLAVAGSQCGHKKNACGFEWVPRVLGKEADPTVTVGLWSQNGAEGGRDVAQIWDEKMGCRSLRTAGQGTVGRALIWVGTTKEQVGGTVLKEIPSWDRKNRSLH